MLIPDEYCDEKSSYAWQKNNKAVSYEKILYLCNEKLSFTDVLFGNGLGWRAFMEVIECQQ